MFLTESCILVLGLVLGSTVVALLALQTKNRVTRTTLVGRKGLISKKESLLSIHIHTLKGFPDSIAIGQGNLRRAEYGGADLTDVLVTEVKNLNVDDVNSLALESEKEGFRFCRRLYDEYESGANRFDRDGEALFVAHQSDRIVGICGLNQDPYSQFGNVGRVRRLYVHPDFRQSGVGRWLVSTVILEAKRFYETLTLRTDNPVADQFYRAIGFSTVHVPDSATHWLSLHQTTINSHLV